MYILDAEKTKLAIKAAGYSSLGEIASNIGVHRNTMNHFLGGAPVFPNSLAKLFELLNVEPSELITKSHKSYSAKLITPIVDALVQQMPDCCFVLFGSRAKGRARTFSDFDLGIFRDSKIPFTVFSKLKDTVEKLADDLPVSVDLVNLTCADQPFLSNIAEGFVFLGGSPMSLEKFEERLHGSKAQNLHRRI